MTLLPDPDEQSGGGSAEGAPIPPQPAAALSPEELDVLARVEADLIGTDPDLGELASRLDGSAAPPLPLVVRWLATIAAGLLALMVAVALLNPAGWAVLALVAILAAPRLLLLAIARGARR